MNHRALLFASATAILLFTTGSAAAGPAPPVREIRVEVVDPGDAGGGLDITTSLIGEHTCSSSTTAALGNRRKLEICVEGDSVYVHIERQADDKQIDVRFAARPAAGTRTRVGKIALGPKQALEAFVTVTP